MDDLPVKFLDKAQESKKASNLGYPIQISASDLDANFSACFLTLSKEESLLEFEDETSGGQVGRKLKSKFPEIPESGEHLVLVSDGAVVTLEIPDGEHVLVARGGKVYFVSIPESGDHAVVAVDGVVGTEEITDC
jgi:hypothetical protein